MLSPADILKKFHQGISSPEGLIQGLDCDINQLSDGYVVIKLNDSMIYSDRYGPYRKHLFSTGRVVSLLQVAAEEAYLLLAPQKERYESVTFIRRRVSETIVARIKDGTVKLETDTSTVPLEKLTSKNVNSYTIDLSEINPEQRIDSLFYAEKNMELARRLDSHPTLEKVADIRCGYHTNFKRRIDSSISSQAAELAQRFAGGSLVGNYPIAFVGAENISSYGSIKGMPYTFEVSRKPKTPPAAKGDIIICLVGARESRARGKEARENDTLGKAAIIETNREFYVNQTFAILKPIGIDPYFLLHTLSSDYFISQLIRHRKPVGKYQSMVTLNDLKKMHVILYDSQKRIELAEKRRGWIELIKRVDTEMKEQQIHLP
ncbi:MAG: hypothetical protein WA666_00380 [Nitrospirota bacterium]